MKGLPAFEMRVRYSYRPCKLAGMVGLKKIPIRYLWKILLNTCPAKGLESSGGKKTGPKVEHQPKPQLYQGMLKDDPPIYFFEAVVKIQAKRKKG